jgi:hypothetical protein
VVNDQEDLFPDLGDKQQGLDLAAEIVPDLTEKDQALPGLDTPQTFEPATSFEVRDAFEKIVRLDLLGPWGGDLEELPPRAVGPRERYLVGMLGPKPLRRSPGEDAGEMPETEIGVEGDGGEGELPEVLTPQNLGRIWASSMGLSFAVPGDVDVLAVTASWGRYGKAETQVEDAKGKMRTISIWSREQIDHDKEIRLDGKPSQRLPLTMERAEAPGVLLAV